MAESNETVGNVIDLCMVAYAEGITYLPWTNGEVIGYRCVTDKGDVSYVYLNPSQHEPGESPNVFVYTGKTGDPEKDSPVTFVDIKEKTNDANS